VLLTPLVVMAVSGSIWLLLPGRVLGGITPALQGIMSEAVDDNQQGELQGALTSVSAMAMIIAPMIMAYVIYAFTGPDAPVYMPGALFHLSAILTARGVMVFLHVGKIAVSADAAGKPRP